MRVAIDISPLKTGHKVRGVGFYLKHLKTALERSDSGIDYQFFNSVDEVNDADIIHFPYFDPFLKENLFNSHLPIVVTIHDLTPIKFAHHFPVGLKGNLYWRLNRQRLKKAAAIITDSQSSKNDIKKFTPVPEKKIHVTYLAAGEAFTPAKLTQARVSELLSRYNLPEKFVLYVGDVTWNKNLPRLIEACNSKDIPLVLVGKALSSSDFDASHPWNCDLVKSKELIKTSKSTHVLGFIDDKDLVDLYRIATVFAMPSLYEGFGLPVIEAMQVGCPVVTSREGSLPEVGGDAVYYVDAYSKKSIAEGISVVFSSAKLQKDLREKGVLQAQNFSWQKTAQQTVQVYHSVLKNER